eukprot:6254283-Prymnesium_polylepis.1
MTPERRRAEGAIRQTNLRESGRASPRPCRPRHRPLPPSSMPRSTVKPKIRAWGDRAPICHASTARASYEKSREPNCCGHSTSGER